jgi:hypothetical protein
MSIHRNSPYNFNQPYIYLQLLPGNVTSFVRSQPKRGVGDILILYQLDRENVASTYLLQEFIWGMPVTSAVLVTIGVSTPVG